MKTTLSCFPGAMARLGGKNPVGATGMVLLLAAAAVPAQRAQASNLVQQLVSPGVVQVLAGDLEGDGVTELVTLGMVDYQYAVRVFRRSGDLWLETESHGLPYLTNPILQLVPQDGPAGGPLGVLYAAPNLDTYSLGLLRNEGGTLATGPELATGLAHQLRLPAAVSTVGALPGGSGWTLVVGGAYGGIYTFQGLAPQTPAFEATPDFNPIQVLVADFSGDGLEDLVAMGLRRTGPYSETFEGQVRSALVGGGWGPWSTIGGYAQEGNPLHAIDMGPDGFRDLAFGSCYTGGDFFFVLMGSGSGLGSPNNILGAKTRRGMRYIPADLDGDGLPEVVTLSFLENPSTYERTTFGFTVYRQNVWGGLDEESVYDVGPAAPPWGTVLDIAVGELDGDGIPDVALAAEDRVTIYPGVGDGTFVATGAVVPRGFRLSLGDDPALVLEVAQMDGQGAPEILVGFESATASLRMYKDNGAFSFAESASADAGPRVTRLAAADLHSDGAMDVVAARTGDTPLAFTYSLATLTPTWWFEWLDGGTGFGEARGMAVHDLNGDGKPELVCTSPGLTGDHFEVYADDGAGGFLPPMSTAFFLPNGVAGLIIGDFTLYGTRELLALNADAAAVQYRNQLIPGGYSGQADSIDLGILPAVESPHPFAVAQFGGPGATFDIVTTDETGLGVRYLAPHWSDTPVWYDGPVYACAGSPWAFASGDLDNDSHQDFAVACRNPDSVTLYRGTDLGNFTRQDIVIGPGATMQDVRIADVTGDGQAELLFITRSSLTASPKASSAATETVLPAALFAVSLPAAPAPSGVPDDPNAAEPASSRVMMAISPNPVCGPASFTFSLPLAGRVSLELFDLRGRRVATLADGEFAPGRHDVLFEGPQLHDLASGVYCARLVTARGSATRQFVRLR